MSSYQLNIYCIVILFLSFCVGQAQDDFQVKQKFRIDFLTLHNEDINPSYRGEKAQSFTYHQYFSYHAKDSNNIFGFLSTLNRMVRDKKINAFDLNTCVDEQSNTMKKVTFTDTIYYETDSFEDTSFVISTIDWTLFYIVLIQEWYFDVKKNEFLIITNSFAPSISGGADMPNWGIPKPLYWIHQNSYASLYNQNNQLTHKNIVWGMRIVHEIPLTSNALEALNREKQGEYWDMKQQLKRSIPLKNICNVNLKELIFLKIKNGEITPVKPGTSESFTPNEFKESLVKKNDTILLDNGEIYSNIDELINFDFNLYIFQNHNFNYKKMTIESKITKAILYRKLYDDYGELIGERPYYEINFNK